MILSINIGFSQTQKFIGGSIGPTAGRFINFSKDDDYEANYLLKPGFIASTFYEIQEDTNAFFRIGVSYLYQQAFSEVNQTFGHISTYSKLNYNFQQLNVNLDYTFLLTADRKIDTRLIFGIGGSYLLNTRVAGNGLGIDNITYVDSNGTQVSMQIQKPWEVNGGNKNALAAFWVNIHLGWSVGIPISESTNVFFQNTYFVSPTNVIRGEDYGHASFLTGAFELGVRYQLNKK